MNTFFKLLIFFLILLAGFASLAFYWTFYKPLPDYDAQIKLNGLEQEVSIQWDEFGVPHIYASTESDLYYAMGYIHAQDRLWQMTLSQIAAEGRFSEFFGPDLVDYDKYQRTIGFYDIAKRITSEVLSESELAILESYSNGVNEFIDQNSNRLPIQFSLADVDPIKWTPEHSVALTRMMAWELNMGWWTEITYDFIRSRLPEEQFRELILSYPDDAPRSLNADQTEGLMGDALIPFLNTEINKRSLFSVSGTHVGSNAWVADGSRTSSGFPLLAGDPHLGLDMPGKWYEVHMNLNDRNVSGATIAGIPLIVIGQNDNMAWSFTSIMSDDTDFFLEQQDPEDRGRYIADSLNDSTAVYLNFDRKKELIKIKGEDDISYEIRYTKHGPVISDIYPTPALLNGQLISMQWSGYELSNEFNTLYGINWAEDFQDFKDALPTFGVPGLNFMYGDKLGNIAMYSVARLPKRIGNPVNLRPGWDPDYDWNDFIPFDELPKVINPEKGWIANANNKLTTDNYPHYIATFWEPPSRIERIEEHLEKNPVYTPELFQEMQNDSYSAYAAELTPLIIEIIRSQNAYNFEEALSYLENWDYIYSENSTAASIFDVFMLKLSENTLKDEMGETAYEQFIHHETVPVRTMTSFLRDSSSFFDDQNTPEAEDKTDMIIKSMQDAIYFLSDTFGSETFEWRWEQLHTITFKPPLFGTAAEAPDAPGSLKLIVNNILSKGPYSMESHGMSINNGQYLWQDPFEMVLGASIRRIADLSDLNKTWSVLPTGQSGNPLSDHYGDQTEMWLQGSYRSFYQDSSSFDESEIRTMKLSPVNNFSQ
ncbi:penicillin acylase family protein [Balneola sp. MJW-20]|uniref:penicillin acylase family protein n=1 Tax=Gracilimonas aurantiaca TaxID=3234185 RepID=UPI003465544C